MHEAEHGQGDGHRVVGEREDQISSNHTEGAFRSVKESDQGLDARLAEIDVGRGERRFSAAVDPDPNRGGGQRCRVVDSIADHDHRTLTGGLPHPFDYGLRMCSAGPRRWIEAEPHHE